MAFNVNNSLKTRVISLGSSNPSIVSGDLVVAGDMVGIAETDAVLRADGDYWVTLAIDGIAHKACTDAVTAGDALFYTDADTVTTTGGLSKFVGLATEYKGAGAGEVHFEIVQLPNVTQA